MARSDCPHLFLSCLLTSWQIHFRRPSDSRVDCRSPRDNSLCSISLQLHKPTRLQPFQKQSDRGIAFVSNATSDHATTAPAAPIQIATTVKNFSAFENNASQCRMDSLTSSSGPQIVYVCLLVLRFQRKYDFCMISPICAFRAAVDVSVGSSTLHSKVLRVSTRLYELPALLIELPKPCRQDRLPDSFQLRRHL